MGETPYRVAEELVADRDATVREVEDECNAFAAGDRCRACGTSGAHPAVLRSGDRYEERSKELTDYPGRVALCESCASAQDEAIHRLDALNRVLVAPVVASLLAQWIIVEFVEPTGDISREVLAVQAVFFATLIATAMWLRRRARRTLLPAVLVAGRDRSITVQLATPAARANPPRAFVGVAPERRMLTLGMLFVVALFTVPVNLIASVLLNGKVDVSGDNRTRVVVNGRYEVSSPRLDAVGWYFYTRGANVRLDFRGPFEVEPLVLDGYDANLVLSTPSCATPTRDGERASVVYRWVRRGHEFRLRCPSVE
ncbi:MAG: hypothetical protein JNK05_36215 [Myxococcales bacterium]|nr:hypothetical protein [Myxococcales bacterium]